MILSRRSSERGGGGGWSEGGSWGERESVRLGDPTGEKSGWKSSSGGEEEEETEGIDATSDSI